MRVPRKLKKYIRKLFQRAEGPALDRIATILGMARKRNSIARYKEPDRLLRVRILDAQVGIAREPDWGGK